MTAPETMAMHCPSEETLAAFVDGRLDAEARRTIVEHAAGCALCRDILVVASEVADSESQGATPRGRSSSWPLYSGLAAAAAVVVVFGAFFVREKFTSRTLPTIVSAAEARSYRPIEGRLSGGFDYRPYRGPKRGNEDPDTLAEYRLMEAESQAFQRNDLHALGVAQVLLKKHDAAVATLQRAADAQPNDESILNDLSAAHYARAQFGDYGPDYTAALDVAERAWQLKRTPEIAWNRAVAMSHVGAVESAVKAWNDFLAIADDPKWRAEGVQRRDDLRSASEIEQWDTTKQQLQTWSLEGKGVALDRAISQHASRARELFEETLIPEWAALRLQGRDTQQAGSVARAIALRLAARGDALPLDAVKAIDQACSTARSCDDLARAHVSFSNAVALMKRHDYERATRSFVDAATGFDQQQSPFGLLTRYRRAASHVYRNEFDEARREAHALLRAVEHTQYRDLLGRTHWLIGLCELHAGSPEKSLRNYRTALTIFEGYASVRDVAALHGVIADALEFVGDDVAASEHRMQALSGLYEAGDRARYATFLFEAGATAFRRGFPDAANVFLAECVHYSRRDSQELAALATIWMAKISSQKGDFATASAHATQAARFSASVLDPARKALVTANLNQSDAGLNGRGDPEARLNASIHFFETASDRAWLPQLLQQRAALHRKELKFDRAENDLRRAVAVLEENMTGTTTAALRYGFAAEARGIYVDLISLLVRRNATDEAFQFSERAKLLGSRATPVNVRDLTSVLPRDVQIIVYERDAEQLFGWIVNASGVAFVRSAGDPEAIPRRWATAARDHEPDRTTLHALYDQLMRPWLRGARSGATLIVVPLSEFGSIQFGALEDAHSRRAIFDDFAVAVAPSVSSYAQATRLIHFRKDSFLVVADPAYTEFPRLARSRLEARDIIEKYPDVSSLVGSDATASAVVQKIQHASAFHFAGHATVNELVPERSALILAGAEGNDARVYMSDLMKLRLHCDLVVLSACSTLKGGDARAKSNISIARAFLDNGASVVVGTLWPVSDEASRRFSRRFYEGLSRQQTPVESARQAQLRLRSESFAFEDWAAFCVLQGGAAREEGDAHA